MDLGSVDLQILSLQNSKVVVSYGAVDSDHRRGWVGVSLTFFTFGQDSNPFVFVLAFEPAHRSFQSVLAVQKMSALESRLFLILLASSLSR